MQGSQLIIPLFIALAFLLAATCMCHHARCKMQDHLELLKKLDPNTVKRMLAQCIATGYITHGELVKLCSDFELDAHDVYEESRRAQVVREARGSPDGIDICAAQCLQCGFKAMTFAEARDHVCPITH